MLENLKNNVLPRLKRILRATLHVALVVGGVSVFIYVLSVAHMPAITYVGSAEVATEPEATSTEPPPPPPWPLPLDTNDFNARMLHLAHYVAPIISTTTSTSTPPPILPVATASSSIHVPGDAWPISATYPEGGAILPFNRVIAYYGNFYSTKMGVLGEYPPNEVLAKLASTTQMWDKVDPSTPTIPAIQYIAVVAQGSPSTEGKYIARMPDSEIDKALAMADQVHGLLILDVQVGLSTLPRELPFLEKYLKLPNVHLAIDPEFSMKYGDPPGTVIGTFDANDINYAASYLAGLVKQYHLPPKFLVVHRFTQAMVTNYQNIQPLPQVEVVMDMDGWGSPAKKKGTYYRVINPEPVQFTGIKLFYKNDLRPPSTRMMTNDEVMDLTPTPVYIQYQ